MPPKQARNSHPQMRTTRSIIISEPGWKPMTRSRRISTIRSTDDYRHDQALCKNNPPVGVVAY